MLCHTSERTAAVHGERRVPVHIRHLSHKHKTPVLCVLIRSCIKVFHYRSWHPEPSLHCLSECVSLQVSALQSALLHTGYDIYMTALSPVCIAHTQKGTSAASPKGKVCMCRQKCRARSRVRSHGCGCWHGSSLPSCSTCTTANSTPVNPLTVFYSVCVSVCLRLRQ